MWSLVDCFTELSLRLSVCTTRGFLPVDKVARICLHQEIVNKMRCPILRDHFVCGKSGSRCILNCFNRCTRRLSMNAGAAATRTFHKRPLPESLISLSSKNGKEIFREALAGGGMESYFSLAEQFVTQSEPSYCALSSLAMVLNALNFDPKKVWKGAWRWVSEETLQCETQICGHSLEKVRRDGMDFDEFESLARCHGIRIKAQKNYSKNHTEICSRDITQFRSYVEAVCSSDRSESFMVANFSRKVLGQTGCGHFSPIGGYHKEKDLVLIMDVARFKYPPFWVPLDVLWASMAVDDEKTKSPRGYFILSTWNSMAAIDVCSTISKTIVKDADSISNISINETMEQNDKIKTIISSNESHNKHVNSKSTFLHDPIGDCPPLIKTWQEFKKHTDNDSGQNACSGCHKKHILQK